MKPPTATTTAALLYRGMLRGLNILIFDNLGQSNANFVAKENVKISSPQKQERTEGVMN